MSPTPPAPGAATTRQFLLAALAEGALLLSIVLLEFLPAELPFLVVSAALFAVGLVLAVSTIYRAVRLMVDPATRSVAYLSIALVVGGPIVLWAVLQLN
ncbi:hypothetical protein [Antiquaquibacter soli]|uniref:Uncharacterized protein n=1 Tax=Antiquaquibacter soli TaxID=3064523 RepID=A0ABT9BN99_9MICO|nr:hypothetical protein [Protaetiibacter sp. WY-16]MDO7882514.1 hypothetical protein [Protaetiibacter sp. WY-16]